MRKLLLLRNESFSFFLNIKTGYQLKAGQVTSWQITRTLRQAQGTSPSVDSGDRFLSLSKGAGE
ncbi:MAG TPA: hypothetical protein ENJ51_02085 [Leucothrix mucor]|uniref:Uncharacterized protein n=1 Tax=Leucothrix mucor TaxID=45248 RepID=A0A7V2WU10_LEUMU|nr:hypothetical protein [Leucothrix mucor]